MKDISIHIYMYINQITLKKKRKYNISDTLPLKCRNCGVNRTVKTIFNACYHLNMKLNKREMIGY